MTNDTENDISELIVTFGKKPHDALSRAIAVSALVKKQSIKTADQREELCRQLGISERLYFEMKQIVKGLSGASKQRIQDTWLANQQKQLVELAKFGRKVQAKALSILLPEDGSIPPTRTVVEALLLAEGGRLPGAMERKFASLIGQLRKLDDDAFAAIMETQESRVMAWAEGRRRLEKPAPLPEVKTLDSHADTAMARWQILNVIYGIMEDQDASFSTATKIFLRSPISHGVSRALIGQAKDRQQTREGLSRRTLYAWHDRAKDTSQSLKLDAMWRISG